jgi:hypothetical protein
VLHDDCLIHGDDSDIAAFLGVSLRTLARYKRHPDKMPLACKRLLRLRMEGDLRAIGGDEWEHFYITHGKLYLPEYRNGFTAHQIRGMFFEVQQVRALQNEMKALKREVWASKKVRETEHNGSRMARIQAQVEALQAVSAALLREVAESVASQV